MWEVDKIREYLKEILKENRYNHVLGVVETAKKLARLNDIDIYKCEIAALCHDVAKNMTIIEMENILREHSIQLSADEKNSPELWHAIIGPIIVKEKFGINDEEVLSAIRWHTTGKENMSKLEKIIYIADMIEPSRSFSGLDKLRDITYKNLDTGVMEGLTHTIKYLLDKNKSIDINTIKARNYLLSCK